MALRKDIEDGQRLDSIEIRVLEAHMGTGSKREWELTVADTLENTFEVIIWATHEVNVQWQEGATYEILNARGETWNDGANIVLHSTSQFTARRADEVVSLLVMGDSHVGREIRKNETEVPNRCAKSFLDAITYAIRFETDAVIHTGDVFDDQAGTEDVVIARSGLEMLEKNGIPFYYILGNHETTKGIDLLDEYSNSIAVHLSTDGIKIGDRVEIVGSDYISPKEFSISARDFSRSPNIDQRILVLHQDLAPVRDHGDIDLSSFVDPPAVDFDYVLAGHLHDAKKYSWRDTEICYIGSTAKISTNPSADNPSAWLLSVTADGVRNDRIDLVKAHLEG